MAADPKPAAASAGDAARVIGVPTATALVMGNMIGSGVFLLPASLAPYGGLSIAGWLVSAGGSVLLALVFARLARWDPAAGGLYAYTRRAFGDLPAFLVGWGYWISAWGANAALAVALVSYLVPFFGTLKESPGLAAVVAIGFVWLLTAVNMVGVRAAGRVQLVTTVLKILPLIVIGFAGLFMFEPAHFAMPEGDTQTIAASLLTTVTLTLWAFLGLESGTVPADRVRDPARTIPRATVIGTLLTAAIYIVSTVGVMSLVPPATLKDTSAPFADAGGALFGPSAVYVVALGAAISCFGALNGWVLIAARLPLAIARDGLFPRAFGRVSGDDTPVRGLIIAAVLATLLVAANYAEGLVALFTFIITLSTLSTLVPYAFCSLAVFVTGRQATGAARLTAGAAAIAALAFVYALLAIGGAGAEVVYWGFLLLLLGLPVYVWVITRR
jgi:APA family basic amino acid/polyamine antiporter